MTGPTTPDLGAAVSNAGDFGMLGAEKLSPDQIVRAVHAMFGASPTVTVATPSNMDILVDDGKTVLPGCRESYWFGSLLSAFLTVGLESAESPERCSIPGLLAALAGMPHYPVVDMPH